MYLNNEDQEGQYRKVLPPFIDKIRILSQEERVPLLEDRVAEFLLFYLSSFSPKEVVEIGTGLGYSASLFSFLFPRANIETVEKNIELAEKAEKLVPQNVKVFPLDALEYFKNREKPIDLLFLDGAKSHYLEIFLEAKPFLNSGAMILADNVFARGITFHPRPKRRLKTIQRGMNRFLKEMTSRYDSYLLPLGDGLLITRYHED